MTAMSERPAIQVPQGYTLRPLHAARAVDLDLVVARSIETMIGTIPELGGSEAHARALIPNLSHEQMRSMYLHDLKHPESHQFTVATHDNGVIAGHAVYFLRFTEPAHPAQAAVRTGYLFTLYVDPSHRRRSLAGALLGHAISWLEDQGAVRVEAHTHVSNAPLLGVTTRCGFEIVARHEKPWPHFELQRAFPQGQGVKMEPGLRK